MINQKKTANAIGGKTARACDSCLKKRATWFCAADDAFLCGGCDSLVHSANELASRHKRVCLDSNPPPPPSWHQGFTKKARTPRNKAKQAVRSSDNYSSQMPVVPEVGYEDELDDQDYGLLVDNIESDQMVFSVPNLDDHHHHADDHKGVSFKGGYEEEEDNISIAESEFNISLIGFDGVNKEWDINNYLPVVGFPDNVELAEFAADVESLLEQDGEDKEKDNNVCYYPGVKLEQEEGGEIISTTINNNDHCCYFDWSMDVENEMFNFDLNNNHSNDDCCGLYDQYSQVSGVEADDKVVVPKVEEDELNYAPSNKQANINIDNNKERRILLRLNYEEVSNAWAASQGCSSPWITGRRPEFDPHHYDWPNSMDKFWPTNTGADRRGEEGTGGVRGQVNDGDGGRSARVLRYREKRRTRLFSKKIRYQVRKLNAEKRPRLKGRFVKRTSLSPSTSTAIGVNVNVGSVESSFPYLHG